MKITFKRIVLLFSILAVLGVMLRVTGFIQSYLIEYDGMEPSIPQGTIVLFKKGKPSKGSVVAFKRKPREIIGIESVQHTEISRVVALEFDTVHLSEYSLFINGEEIDDYPLQYLYRVPIEHVSTVSEAIPGSIVSRTDFSAIMKISDENFATFLSDFEFEKLNSDLLLFKKFDASYGGFQASWSLKDFGPFVVPKDHCFVLSDFRNSALDSRSYGPIALSEIEGVRTKNIDWLLKSLQEE